MNNVHTYTKAGTVSKYGTFISMVAHALAVVCDIHSRLLYNTYTSHTYTESNIYKF